jgi:hypothetical protein
MQLKTFTGTAGFIMGVPFAAPVFAPDAATATEINTTIMKHAISIFLIKSPPIKTEL